MVANATGSGLRRIPRQTRSEQRFDVILDTTATLIDEVGYANITTSIIANRVGMSGPGIYRYFDGLPAIATALAARNLTRFLERVSATLTDDTPAWPDALTHTVAIYCDMHRTEPGFRWMRLGDTIDHHHINKTGTNHAAAAQMLANLLVTHYQVTPSDGLLHHIEVIIEIVDSLTARAFTTSSNESHVVIDETSRIITQYLRDYLASPANEERNVY